MLSAGSHALWFLFTPTDTVDYTTVIGSRTQVVTKAPTATILGFTSPVNYGAENAAGFSVGVLSSTGAIPTGNVAIRTTVGSTVVTCVRRP